MNILSICFYDYYRYYSSSFVHNQAKAFVDDGDRVRVIILTPIGKTGGVNRFSFRPTRMTVDGVELVYLRYLSLSNYGNKHFNHSSACFFGKINRSTILKNFKPDIIHIHTIGLSSFVDDVGLHKLAPVVATAHGSDVNIPYSDNCFEYIKERCDSSDAVIAVSSVLEKKIKQTKTKAYVQTVLNGFESFTSADENKIINGNWIQVGNLVPGKHVDTTIKAFAKFLKAYPGKILTIIGEGPEKCNLQKVVSDLGIVDNVKFLGQMDNQDVLKEMSKATFFSMISAPEGLGIVYLEAMNAKCITIGTEGEGISDVIINGFNGFLVPIDDFKRVADIAISCMKKPLDTQIMMEKAKESVANINWKNNIQQVKAIFLYTIEVNRC